MKYIYGTAADPITKAHLAILKAVAKHMTANDELIITISNDDEKEYKATYEQREMLVANAVKPYTKFGSVTIMEQKFRMRYFLNTYFKGQEDQITLVVGQDEWEALLDGKWVNGDQLLKNYHFVVAKRDYDKCDEAMNEVEVPEGMAEQVHVITAKGAMGVSSSKVRWLFYIDPETKYRDVQDFITLGVFKDIKEHGLYNQLGEKHAAEMEAFLADYAKKKEENHWGEPSVTTDVIAYNGSEILLIRRKKDPYKNYWALPGGFFEKTDQDLNYGAAREFKEETTLDYPPEAFQQIRAYGHNFDPRMKICDVAFAVRIHRDDMKKAVGADDAAEARWFDINDLPALAFHHANIINDWMDTTLN